MSVGSEALTSPADGGMAPITAEMPSYAPRVTHWGNYQFARCLNVLLPLLLIDGTSLLFLSVVAYFQLFRRAASMSLSSDGFMLVMLLHKGLLPPVVYGIPADQPNGFVGRPFIGLGWNIAHVLGGGTVTGYYMFMFVCLLLSSLMVYALVRTVVPDKPLWAFVAAALKLVWIANYQILVDHSLAIYFVELLFWIATYALVVLLRRRTRSLSRVLTVAVAVVMSTCLIITMRTYEASWTMIPIVPVLVLLLLRPSWRARSTMLVLGVWYTACLAAFVSAFSRDGLLPLLQLLLQQSTAPEGQQGSPLLGRMLVGLDAVTITSFTLPVQEAWLVLSGQSTEFSRYSMAASRSAVGLLVLAFACLYVLIGVRTLWPRQAASSAEPDATLEARTPSAGQPDYRSVSGLLLLTAALVIFAGLLPFATWIEPVYGSRYVHWAAFGTIIGVMAFCVWLVGALRLVGFVVAGLLVTTMFAASIFRMDELATYGEINGAGQRSFWQQLVERVPGLTEDSVLILEDSPRFISLPDGFLTAVVRGFTGTLDTWALAEDKADWRIGADGREVVVGRTNLVVNEPLADWMRRLAELGTILGYDERFDVEIDPERVVWVKWYPDTMKLALVEARTEMSRVLPTSPDGVGRELFPNGETIPALAYQLDAPRQPRETPEQTIERLQAEADRFRAVAEQMHGEAERLLAITQQAEKTQKALEARVQEQEQALRSKDRDLKDARREIERLRAK